MPNGDLGATRTETATRNDTPPPNDATGRNDAPFYVVLSIVVVITLSSLGLGIWTGHQRTTYVNEGITRLESLVPKGDVKTSEIQSYDDMKNAINKETESQENTITILMAVFQAGSGAILGLLTGRATAR